MDIKIGGEKHFAAPAATHAETTESQPLRHYQQQQQQQRKGRGSIAAVVGAVAVLILLGLVVWLGFIKDGNVFAASHINEDDHQAVFLTNGQVYFGDLQNAKGDYLSLKNIYYLQVKNSIQPSSGDSSSSVSTKKDSSSSDDSVQLIKLGNELHGPEDQMQVSKDQVLFWENLKQDGKVSKAIENYAKNN